MASMQSPDVVSVIGAGLPSLLPLFSTFLADSMRLSWISDCYNFLVFYTRTRQQSQMLRKEKNRMPCQSFQCRKCRRSVVAKDSVPKMHALFIAVCEPGSHRCKVCSLFCVRGIDQGQLVLDGGRLNKTLSNVGLSHIMQFYAVVRSKGANSWSKVRSPLLVLNAVTVHG